MLLSVRNFSLEIKQENGLKPILHNIDFSIQKGETVGIVGESGSGKSVTALSIMRLMNDKTTAVSSGDIIMYDDDGREHSLLRLNEHALQKIRGNKIGMIFQEPMTSLNPVITCGKQITEALLLHTAMTKKEAYSKVISLFEEVMLPRPEKIFDSYPHEISGGQKQRVMIAMAMCCQPQLLIADEPTTALDVTVQKGILDLLKKLQKKYDMSVLFITHDLGVVAEIADRVIVLYQGKIVETGTASQLFRLPQHPYTKGLLACRPPLNVRLKVLPTVDDFMHSFHPEKNEQTPLTVEQQIVTPEERNAFHQQLYDKNPFIQIQHLTKSFPVRKNKLFEKRDYVYALQDVSLTIYEGETLGLVGESGCGKTTLGRAMIRLISPSTGTVLFNGKNLMALSEKEMRTIRKDLQIILQDPYSSLNQRITIGETLVEPMRVHRLYHNEKERKNKAFALLERVGLNENHFYRYPHEFSGGQRQRISIARALAVNPKFIICDESVSALDVSVQAQVLNLLNELKKEFNFTYLFISHDLSVVKFMSDRIAVMQNGRIVELNDADRLYFHPQTDYTKQLINAIPKGIN